jgi:hypothetical protein
MKFSMTARRLARQRDRGIETLTELDRLNLEKATQFREGGVALLEAAIKNIQLEGEGEKKGEKENVEEPEAREAAKKGEKSDQ